MAELPEPLPLTGGATGAGGEGVAGQSHAGLPPSTAQGRLARAALRRAGEALLAAAPLLDDLDAKVRAEGVSQQWLYQFARNQMQWARPNCMD